MLPTIKLAFDRSLRTVDADGRLHVEVCNISAARVNPYLGREIPNSEALGLDPTKIYYLYRDAAELAAGASTFNNLPLLIRHVPISADLPQQDLVVGTTGSDAHFEAPYLKASLAIWTTEAKLLVESGDLEQLSCAYRYRADMTPGTYEGVAYDGVMRDIIGNHVALVEEGRAGPDVVVADSKLVPIPLEFSKMRFKHAMAVLAALIPTASQAQLTAFDAAMEKDMADDADLTDEEKKAAEDSAMEAKAKDGKACDALTDEEKEAAYKSAKDKKAKDAKANDADPEMKPKGANDSKTVITQADVDAAASRASADAVAKVNALHQARAEVQPIIGVVAFDSAEAVYEAALKHLKVDVKDVPKASYGAVLRAVSAHRANVTTAPRVALDSTITEETAKAFPGLARIRTLG